MDTHRRRIASFAIQTRPHGAPTWVRQHVRKIPSSKKKNVSLRGKRVVGKSERDAMPAARKDIASRVEEIMREGSVDENTALKVVAKEQGISKSEAYRELQRRRSRTSKGTSGGNRWKPVRQK